MIHNFIFFAHILATAVMTGIVWFVQIIHYPLFAVVDGENFAAYEKEHIRRTKYLIMPAMLLELGTGILLVFTTNVSEQLFWTNLVALVLIWLSTFFVQVPLHSRLTIAKNARSINQLVQSNWLRTVLWTARMILLIWIILFEI